MIKKTGNSLTVNIVDSFHIELYLRFLNLVVPWNSQSAHDVPGTSPESPLKVLTSGIYRGPPGDQYKN